MSKSTDQTWRGIDSKVFKVQCEGSGASDVLGFWFLVVVGPKLPSYWEILVHFMLPSADKTLWR